MNKKLDPGELAEIKDLYDGTYTSIRYLAKLFGIKEWRMRWVTNHNNHRERQHKRTQKWKNKNPEKSRIIQVRACRVYYDRNKKEVIKKTTGYNKKNKERVNERQRINYQLRKNARVM